MALGQVVGGANLLLGRRQAEQPQFVGQRRLAQAQAAGSLSLGAAPKADHFPQAPGGVKGVQLAALDVLQKAQGGALAVRPVGQDGGHLIQLGQLAGPQPPLAGDQLVFAQPHPPHADGLQQPVLQNAHRQGRNLGLIKGGARLPGGRFDGVHRQQQHLAGSLFFVHGSTSLFCGRGLAEWQTKRPAPVLQRHKTQRRPKKPGGRNPAPGVPGRRPPYSCRCCVSI